MQVITTLRVIATTTALLAIGCGAQAQMSDAKGPPRVIVRALSSTSSTHVAANSHAVIGAEVDVGLAAAVLDTLCLGAAGDAALITSADLYVDADGDGAITAADAHLATGIVSDAGVAFDQLNVGLESNTALLVDLGLSGAAGSTELTVDADASVIVDDSGADCDIDGTLVASISIDASGGADVTCEDEPAPVDDGGECPIDVVDAVCEIL